MLTCQLVNLSTMKIKMILPALQEAESPYWRPIKYSLFPPLGLATLAAYFSDDDEVELQDQHVEKSTTILTWCAYKCMSPTLIAPMKLLTVIDKEGCM